MNPGASTLREYLAVLRRRKWIALSAIVTVPVVAVVLSMLQSPKYSASADVLVSQSLANVLSGVQGVSISTDPQRIIDTQTSVAASPAVAAAVVKASTLDLTPGQFLGMSSVSAKTDQDILVFHVDNRYPAVDVEDEDVLVGLRADAG